MSAIVVKKDGKIMCTYYNEASLPDKDIIKQMKAAGYKLYQDGKLYKPEVTKKKTAQN